VAVINALVKASGTLGLAAFMPPQGRVLRAESGGESGKTLPPPHLPLVKNWNDGSFSLKSVLHPWLENTSGSLNVREWMMKMLMRYRFSLGTFNCH
jgi:hypothetical protein